MSLSLSVLIPTLGRQKELLDTVKALLEQTHLPTEIIVVDQNVPEFKEVSDYLKTISLVRHIKGMSPGVVPNYNRCLKSATGDVVLYLDDDIVPDRELIKNHLKNYDDPTIAAVAGRVRQAFGDGDPRMIQKVGSYNHWTGKVMANFNALERVEVQFCQGANMSFRREALLSIQGFDPLFDGNGYFFETDAGLRLLQKGYKIVFDPTAEILHLLTPAGGARVKDKALHTSFFLKNGMKLYRRHSPALGLPLYFASQLTYACVKAFYNRDLRILSRGVPALLQGLLDPAKNRVSSRSL